ncbi:hypothetical protein HHI36_002721 [Cryptolaemus montrouzieri]|uniref:Uncharacterized protein n=1 Tax=Cryptolaemus montrouzieri TaxID=559131 RepID=A0ABD2PBA8_9CUCU
MVNSIINELTNGVSNVDVTSYGIFKVVRVCKSTPDHIRALKVVTSSVSKVKVVLKDKSNIENSERFSTVRIDGDFTEIQRKQLKDLRSDLNRRKENGENVTIKYVCGSPTIVESRKPNT